MEKLIKNVEIGELEVFPVSKNILSQMFKNYIVSPNANFYQPQEFTVNWEKIEIENIPYLLPAYDIKLVKKIKVNNVTIYYYQDKKACIREKATDKIIIIKPIIGCCTSIKIITPATTIILTAICPIPCPIKFSI